MEKAIEKMPISVLMSVYQKDAPAFLEAAIESILRQTYMPKEIVIVEDGQLPENLSQILNKYEDEYTSLFKIIPLKVNQGLGVALGIGVNNCSYDLIARMDSDDIACSNRLELQEEEFRRDPNLDLLGGEIEEFEEEPLKIVTKRVVPLGEKEIYRRVKTRNPFNHMTVMFRKNSLLSVGNYPKTRYAQDYFLWIEMIHAGCHMRNLPDTLVLARTGDSMYRRRGGAQYCQLEKEIQNKMLEYGMISAFEAKRNIILRSIVRKMGNGGRRFVYRTFLRK